MSLNHSPHVVTLVSKLRAHITDDILSTYTNFRSSLLKTTMAVTPTAVLKDEQQSVTVELKLSESIETRFHSDN